MIFFVKLTLVHCGAIGAWVSVPVLMTGFHMTKETFTRSTTNLVVSNPPKSNAKEEE